jgi:hypothetical protein
MTLHVLPSPVPSWRHPHDSVVIYLLKQICLAIRGLCEQVKRSLQVHGGGYNTVQFASGIVSKLHKGYKPTEVDIGRYITIQCQLAIDGNDKSRLSPICPKVIRHTHYPWYSYRS